MSDPLRHPTSRGETSPARHGHSLADILERVLDKGIVIAGDIRVDLLDIELLTIRVRLFISSADKADELGMAWWRQDPFFTGEPAPRAEHSDGDGGEERSGALQQLANATDELKRRVDQLEGDGGEASPEASTAPGVDDDVG